MDWYLGLNDMPFDAIKNGKKNRETRTKTSSNMRAYEQMKAGDRIIFNRKSDKERLVCEILGVRHYPDVAAMFDAEGQENCMSYDTSRDEAIASYDQLRGYTEGIKQYGIWAVEVKPTKKVSDIDDWTIELFDLMMNMARAVKAEDKRYYFGGGFAIDLQVGRLTRNHEDLDFYPDEADTQFWQDWFKERGFLISKDPDMENYPNAFLPTNEQKDYFADVYPIRFEEDGRVSMLNKDGFQGVWEGKNWKNNQEMEYQGVKVWVEDYKSVLEQKRTGGPLTEKHLHDFALFDEQP